MTKQKAVNLNIKQNKINDIGILEIISNNKKMVSSYLRIVC